MQFEQDSRYRVLKRLAIGAGVVALPLAGYAIGLLQGGSPQPEPKEIVLSGAVAPQTVTEAAPQEDAAATPQPAELPAEPLAADRAPEPKELELAKAPEPAPSAELTAPRTAPPRPEKLSSEEAELLEPSVAYLASSGGSLVDEQVAALAIEEPESDPLQIETLTVERGDTLMGILTEAGVARQEAYEAITALEEVFSPRRLRAGQEIKVAMTGPTEELTLVSLALQPDVETDVSVGRNDDGAFVALSTPRELTLASEYGRGVIETSLYEASIAAGMPHGSLMELIRIFSFDVDFQRDIRGGDSFEALFDINYDANGEMVKTGEVRLAALTLSGKERRYYRYTTTEGEVDYFDAEGKSVRRTLMRTPIDGARLSSGFGMRKHPILGYSKMHKGTDFAAPSGTPIYAAGNGSIVKAGRNGGYGNYIRIRHNSRYQTAYAHLKGFAKGIKSGARVEQGQIIGYVGTTGRSTGPHLHYEVLVDGTQVNPRNIKLPTGLTLEGTELARFQEERAKLEQELAGLKLTDQQVAENGGCGKPDVNGAIEQGSGDC
ncbi:peptidoglycan DD-metalloendopeptidase family protein [Limibacillus halophilus]